MQWASTVATAAYLGDALDETLETLDEDLRGAAPHLVLAFTHGDYADHLSHLVRGVYERYPDTLLIGCSAGGVIGGGVEVEEQAALSLTAAVLPGVEVQPFHIDGTPEGWRERIGASNERPAAFLLFPEPFTCPVEDTVRWLDTVYPGHAKAGGVASGGSQPGTAVLLAGDRVVRSGVVGVTLRGNVEVDTIVAQGCRPIGTPLFVTRADGDLILELDGQPAVLALETLYTQLPPADQELLRRSLFVGLVADPTKQRYAHGDFLVRDVLGADRDLGALIVNTEVEHNQVVQFHVRDAATSAADLIAMLDAYAGPPPAGALLFSCMGRGQGLYGQPNHDSDAFRRRFGEVALGGFFGNGEIGPVGAHTFVHGYTSAFALFRPRHRT